jgi:hypothetical protein
MYHMHSTAEYPAKTTGSQCTSRARGSFAPMSTRAMCGTWATASAAAIILLFQTGVSASVSLFVLLITLGNLLLVSLLGLSWLLSLSGLTGLVLSSVGLIKGLSPGTKTGD